MPRQAPAANEIQDELLESQLERLFSDFGTSELNATYDAASAVPIKTPQRSIPPAAHQSTGDLPLPAHKRPSYRTRFESRLISGLLSTIVALIVVAAFAVVWQNGAAQSGAIATPPKKNGSLVAYGPPTGTPTASATPERARISVVPSVTTIEILTNAKVVKSDPLVNEQATTFSPSATASPAHNTPTDHPADRVATSASTRVAITATDDPTHTVAPATPTFRPLRAVQPATTTPVPAGQIGLDAIPTPVPRITLPENAVNIVLLGSDQRPYETYWRTDVIIVISVNPDLPSVSMLSVPRDTWLYIPNWTYQRINLADTHGAAVGYPGGGPGLVKATIEYNFGIHVDYFARVDFAGLMRIVDALDGIDILLDCPVADGFPDDPITEDPSVVTQISYPEPGMYHLDGKHALWLARSRKTTSEFSRSRRQHRILQGIWAKANQLGFIARLPELWEELITAVQTDLTLENVLWLASIGLKLDPAHIQSGFIDGRFLTAWVSPGGANVLLPHIDDILAAVEPLFNPYPHKAPQGLNMVEIWNGSGHDSWGVLAADRLIRNGFKVSNLGNTSELYERSIVFDYTGSTKGSPLPLLQRLFDAEITHISSQTFTESEQDLGVSYRLIVGADYQPCEWPAPARWAPTATPPPSTGN